MVASLLTPLLLCLGLGHVFSCSLTKMPDHMSMPALFSRAPTVVHAKTTSNVTHGGTVMARLDVYCVFKHTGDEDSFPQTITLDGFIEASSCLKNPDYQDNKEFIFAIEHQDGEAADRFRNFVPDAQQTNIYASDDEILQDLLNVCTMDPEPLASHSCPTGKDPTGDDTTDDCDAAVRAETPLLLLLTTLLVYLTTYIM